MPWDERIGRNLKLKDLHTLMAVIEAGGMGKAAERLNYSQPAVSKAIAGLERTVGKRLLERGRKGIELTLYGEALLKCGVAVFDDLRKGVADIDFLSDPTSGEVRIGCTEPVSAGILSAVIDLLSRRHPRIVFQVILRDAPSIFIELEARNVDFVITQLTHGIDQEYMHCESLYDEPIVIVAGAHHPSAHKRRVKLADLVERTLGAAASSKFYQHALCGRVSHGWVGAAPHDRSDAICLFAHHAGRRRPLSHDRPRRHDESWRQAVGDQDASGRIARQSQAGRDCHLKKSRAEPGRPVIHRTHTHSRQHDDQRLRAVEAMFVSRPTADIKGCHRQVSSRVSRLRRLASIRTGAAPMCPRLHLGNAGSTIKSCRRLHRQRSHNPLCDGGCRYQAFQHNDRADATEHHL